MPPLRSAHHHQLSIPGPPSAEGDGGDGLGSHFPPSLLRGLSVEEVFLPVAQRHLPLPLSPFVHHLEVHGLGEALKQPRHRKTRIKDQVTVLGERLQH